MLKSVSCQWSDPRVLRGLGIKDGAASLPAAAVLDGDVGRRYVVRARIVLTMV